MNTIEKLLEELNETDITLNLSMLTSEISNLESVELERDFIDGVTEAIQAALRVLRELKSLRKMALEE